MRPPAIHGIGILWLGCKRPVKIRYCLAEPAEVLVGLAPEKVDPAILRYELRRLIERVNGILVPLHLIKGESFVEPCIRCEGVLFDGMVERCHSIAIPFGLVLGSPAYHPEVCMIGLGGKEGRGGLHCFSVPFLFGKDERAVIPDPGIRRIKGMGLFEGSKSLFVPPDFVQGDPHVVKRLRILRDDLDCPPVCENCILVSAEICKGNPLVVIDLCMAGIYRKRMVVSRYCVLVPAKFIE